MLKLEQVSKTYTRRHSSISALIGISLEVSHGEFVGLYGPSRSGKTTLLRLAAGLESPDAGNVIYNDDEISAMPDRQLRYYLRKQVGCVWTERQQLPGFEVLDVVALPLLMETRDRQQSEHRARQLLASVGAEQCVDAGMHELSDGEHRRVMIARAIITKPRLLLADEPTATLAPLERDSILELLQSLAREANMAVLATGPEASDVLRARPIISINRGRLVKPRSADQVAELIEFPTNASAWQRTSERGH